MFFTNWGLILTQISLYLTIKCANDYTVREKPRVLGFNHLLFEFCVVMEIIITIVYWSIIHSVVAPTKTTHL